MTFLAGGTTSPFCHLFYHFIFPFISSHFLFLSHFLFSLSLLYLSPLSSPLIFSCFPTLFIPPFVLFNSPHLSFLFLSLSISTSSLSLSPHFIIFLLHSPELAATLSSCIHLFSYPPSFIPPFHSSLYLFIFHSPFIILQLISSFPHLSSSALSLTLSS